MDKKKAALMWTAAEIEAVQLTGRELDIGSNSDMARILKSTDYRRDQKSSPV